MTDEQKSQANAGAGCPNGSEGGHHNEPPEFDARAEPYGSDQSRIDQAVSALLSHLSVRALTSQGEHRVTSFALENEGRAPACTSRTGKRVEQYCADRFVGTDYDYNENRVLEIRGQFHALDAEVPGPVEVRLLGHQPLPTGEEFAAAVEIVRHERDFRERLACDEIAVYRPMPPFIDRQLPEGRVEHSLTVGLRATRKEAPFHEIVAVSMFDRRVIRGTIEGMVHSVTRRPLHYLLKGEKQHEKDNYNGVDSSNSLVVPHESSCRCPEGRMVR